MNFVFKFKEGIEEYCIIKFMQVLRERFVKEFACVSCEKYGGS